MGRDMSFPTMWYVRPAKPQISLRIRAVWSEPLLVAWIFYDCLATDWTSFVVSKLKGRVHRLVWVYSCQKATLLEITCHSSLLFLLRVSGCWMRTRKGLLLTKPSDSVYSTRKITQTTNTNQEDASLWKVQARITTTPTHFQRVSCSRRFRTVLHHRWAMTAVTVRPITILMVHPLHRPRPISMTSWICRSAWMRERGQDIYKVILVSAFFLPIYGTCH